MVTVKKVRRLKIVAVVVVVVAVHPRNPRELTDDVHVHDPMHNSVLIHVISRYLHSFIVLLLVFYYDLKYYVAVT